MEKDFLQFFDDSYAPLRGLEIGRPLCGESVLNDREVQIPLRMLTRHGLVTGSTGTGKSRVIQLIIEQLTEHGIPTLLSDIKGDMSGFSFAGDLSKISERANLLAHPPTTTAYAAHYWGQTKGLIRFRVKLSDIHFILLARFLSLNETQESHLGTIYKYAKDNKIQIDDINDLKELLSYLIRYPEKNIGSSKSSLSVIYRKISNLELTELDAFFGSPAFEINDLLTPNPNILWLQNFQQGENNIGNLISFLLYRLYNELPEIGDVKEPKIVIFIDEAHQLFSNANKTLIDLLVSILKKIRSKGVGIIFNTQSVDDIPEAILEQLGLKIQFALRAFTGKELEEIRGILRTFPQTSFYNLSEEIKSMENGTCFVSVMNDSGSLLPPIKTTIYPPKSMIDAPTKEALSQKNNSVLLQKYGETKKREPLKLGSPLDQISLSRGGKWHIMQYIQTKEEQRTERRNNKKRKNIKSFLLLLIALTGIIAFIFFLFLIFQIIHTLKSSS